MDKMIVQGGNQLNGSVPVSGAKNSALPILMATLLAKGKHRFRNVPRLQDIISTQKLLESLGCEVERNGDEFIVDVKNEDSVEAAYDQVAISIAAFERTQLFGQFSSKYDAYLQA